jgi:hypothetical protein
MIEVLILGWVFTGVICVYLYIKHKLDEKKDKLKKIDDEK